MGDNCVSIHPSVVNAAGGDTSVRSSQPRARSRFKAEIAKLPLRFAHAVGLKCATVAPEEDLQSRYLSTLSQDKMNSTDVLMELMNFIGDYENTAPDSDEMKKLSDFQLYSLYRNFKEHGELISALREFGLNRASGVSDGQELLTYVTAMCDTLEETRNEVEKLLTERRIVFDFKVGATSDDNQKKFILEALEEAWVAAAADVGSHPIGYITQALIERSTDRACKREGGSGPVSRLTELYDQFSQLGEVKPALLRPLLTSALRRARVRDPKGRAGEIAVILAGKQDKQLLGKLFHRLYYAMVRQIDGSRRARHDLLEAINKIEEKGQKGEKTRIPEFADAQDQNSVWAAIHELTAYASHQGTEYFYEAVMRALAEKEFKGETAENFLYQAQTLDLTGYSAIALEIMRQVYDGQLQAESAGSRRVERVDDGSEEDAQLLQPGVQTIEPELEREEIAQPQESASGDQAEIQSVRPTAPVISQRATELAADMTVFEQILLPCFGLLSYRFEDLELVEVDVEIDNALQQAQPDEIVLVRDFFLRHSWMPDYFIQSDNREEKLFGIICNQFMTISNRMVPDDGPRASEFWIERRQASFMKVIKSWTYDSTAALLEDMKWASEVPGPFREYFRKCKNELLYGIFDARDPLEYLELLNEITEAARVVTVNDSEETFRERVVSILSPAVNDLRRAGDLERLKQVVERYPAFGNRRPRALMARQDEFNHLSQNEFETALQTVDRIWVVADILRDLLDLGHGGANAGAIRLLSDYSEQILRRSGNVREAVRELREAREKPASPDHRQRVAKRSNLQNRQPSQRAPTPLSRPPLTRPTEG
jgi:hypothetical protein